MLKQLPGLLLPWFAKHRRDLPWRRDREPYHVWLSEIMLQQTRVEAVRGYYLRFLERLPDIAASSRGSFPPSAPCPVSATIPPGPSPPSALKRPLPPWTATFCA